MIQEEASIPASFVHCGPHSFTLTSFVHPYLIRSLLALIRSLPAHIRSLLTHIRSLLPHIRSSLPHSFSAGHIRSVLAHIRSLPAHIRSLLTHIRSLLPHILSSLATSSILKIGLIVTFKKNLWLTIIQNPLNSRK